MATSPNPSGRSEGTSTTSAVGHARSRVVDVAHDADRVRSGPGRGPARPRRPGRRCAAARPAPRATRRCPPPATRPAACGGPCRCSSGWPRRCPTVRSGPRAAGPRPGSGVPLWITVVRALQGGRQRVDDRLRHRDQAVAAAAGAGQRQGVGPSPDLLELSEHGGTRASAGDRGGEQRGARRAAHDVARDRRSSPSRRAPRPSRAGRDRAACVRAPQDGQVEVPDRRAALLEPVAERRARAAGAGGRWAARPPRVHARVGHGRVDHQQEHAVGAVQLVAGVGEDDTGSRRHRALVRRRRVCTVGRMAAV